MKRIALRHGTMQYGDTRVLRTFENFFIQFSGYDPEILVGADGGEGTPVPIPNTAVKLTCADNTWLVAAREDRKAPTQSKTSTVSSRSFAL